MYEKYMKMSFNIAYRKIKNKDVAEDIASQTIYSYLLNSDRVENDKIKSWIYSTTINYIKKYFEANKKNNTFQQNVRLSFKKKINNDEKINLIKLSFEKSKKYLSENEKKVLELFINQNLNIKKTANLLNKNPDNLRKMIYLIKKKMQAYTYQEYGYKVTKLIVPPNINRVLLKFLKILKTSLQSNSYNDLKTYLSQNQINYIKKNVKIKQIEDYEVKLENSIYQFMIIYINFDDKPETLIIELQVLNSTSFKIVSIKKGDKKIYVLPLDSEEGQKILKMLNHAKKNRDGTKNIPYEIMIQLIEQYEAKKKTEEKEEEKKD